MNNVPLVSDDRWTVRSNRLQEGLYGRLTVVPPTNAVLPPLPGQFYMVRLGSGLDPLLRRPFSASRILTRQGSAPGHPSFELEFLYKIVGKGTKIMARLQPGQEIDCIGPLGNGFTLPHPEAESPFDGLDLTILVAGGIGIAPFPLLAEDLARRGVRTSLFFGGRTASDLVALDLFEKLGVSLHIATEDGSAGRKGFVTEPLAEVLPTVPRGRTVIYACGPNAMMARVTELAILNRVPVEVSLETRMGCGLGVCLGCVVPLKQNVTAGGLPYARVCQEGPVFGGEEVDLGVFD